MANFREVTLGTNDLVQIREMVNNVSLGMKSVSAILRDSHLTCKVYSMGETNPIIRVDIRRVKI